MVLAVWPAGSLATTGTPPPRASEPDPPAARESEKGFPGLRPCELVSYGARGTVVWAVFFLTEQGVAMLSSVLRSAQAVAVNIEIMRAFVRLRAMLASHADLARKLDALDRKYDAQFKVVFNAIRQLMTPPAKKVELGSTPSASRPSRRSPPQKNPGGRSVDLRNALRVLAVPYCAATDGPQRLLPAVEPVGR